MTAQKQQKKEFFEYRILDSGEYGCMFCDKSSKNQTTIHMHIRAKHMGDFKFKCEHCDYEAALKQHLDCHMAAKHTDVKEIEKNFECLCGTSFRTKAQLRSHYLLKHLNEEVEELYLKGEGGKCSCSECGDEFKSKPAFIYHVPHCFSPEIRQALGEDICEVFGIEAT
jgi:hypothetical protein